MNRGYANLKGEIAKRGITQSEIAALLKMHPNTVSNKINGDSSFSIEEAFKIKQAFFPEMDLSYLFDSEKRVGWWSGRKRKGTITVHETGRDCTLYSFGTAPFGS